MGGLVGADSFTNTFHVDTKTNAGANMIGLIVAIVSAHTFELAKCYTYMHSHSTKSAASSAP
jgi:hypothetical protein